MSISSRLRSSRPDGCAFDTRYAPAGAWRVPTLNGSSARRTSMPWLARLSASLAASVGSDPAISTYSRVAAFSPSLIAVRRYS